MAEMENFCHRVRTKGNWDVGRFGRVKFLARINHAAPPACARPYAGRARPAGLREAGVYILTPSSNK